MIYVHLLKMSQRRVQCHTNFLEKNVRRYKVSVEK